MIFFQMIVSTELLTEISMLIVLGAAAHYFLILATSKLHRYASGVLKFNSSTLIASVCSFAPGKAQTHKLSITLLFAVLQAALRHI